jgi:hypothetical protein
MALSLSPIGGAAAQFFDDFGNVLTGGKLFTYDAGTTTPAVTYTTPLGNVYNTNPIILNAAGRPPQEIWLILKAYKFVLTTSTDVLIGSWDNINGIPAGGVQEYVVATQGQTIVNVNFIYLPGNNSLNVFVNGNKQIVGLNYVETDISTVTFLTGLNAGDIVEFFVV